jgi:hypothetical protein
MKVRFFCTESKATPDLLQMLITRLHSIRQKGFRIWKACFSTYIRPCLFERSTSPTGLGIPLYRTKVVYVPQRPSILAGTPRDFLDFVSSFKSRAKSNDAKRTAIDVGKPIDVAKAWGVHEELWDREWSKLSGGESQRVTLALAVGLDTAEVLLLDGKSRSLYHWQCCDSLGALRRTDFGVGSRFYYCS